MRYRVKKNGILIVLSVLFLSMFVFFGSHSQFSEIDGYLYDKGKSGNVTLRTNEEIKQKTEVIMTDTAEIIYFSDNSSDVQVSIFDIYNHLLKQVVVDSVDGKLRVPLNDVDLFDGKEIIVSIVNKGELPITLQAIKSPDYNKSEDISSQYLLKTNYKGIDETFKKTYTTVFGLLTVITLILLCISIRKTKKYINIMDHCIDKLIGKKLIYPIEVVLFFSLMMVFLNAFVDLWYLRNFNLMLWTLTFLLASIAIVYFVELLFRFEHRVERLFVVIAIPIAIGYLFLMVPNSIPDELVHFTKTYLTSQFQWGSYPYSEIPDSMTVLVNYNYKEWQELLFSKTNYDSVIPTVTCSYNFILYLIPSIGFMIGRLLQVSIVFAYLLARLCNALFYIWIGYVCIKRIPFGKWLLFVFLLNPMILHLAASLSADNLVNCISFLTITHCLYIYKVERDIQWKDILLLGITFIILVLTKPNYLPLFGLLFLSYKKIFKMDKKLWCIVISIPVLSVCLYIMFAWITAQAAIPGTPIENVDGGKQLSSIIHNPIEFAKTILITIRAKGQFYIESMFLTPLSWLNLNINTIFLWFYFIIVSIAVLTEDVQVKMKNISKFWISMISGIMIFAIFLALYLTWTPVGSSIVEGIQGRYFLPIAFLLLLLTLGKKKLYINKPHIKIIAMLFVLHAFVFYKILGFFG